MPTGTPRPAKPAPPDPDTMDLMKPTNKTAGVNRARHANLGNPYGLVLPRDFYDRDTLDVAQSLVGTYLHRRIVHRGEPVELVGRITETEGYLGADDDAAHSARGYTHRTRAMFGPPGHAYVYFIYGMHWSLNAVAGPVGNGHGVLIRAIEPVAGVDVMQELRGGAKAIADGPGKLCQALRITGDDYGVDLTVDNGVDAAQPSLFLTEATQDVEVRATPRIGIAKATTRDKPWRFIDPQFRRK